jgi:hypothetical protein
MLKFLFAIVLKLKYPRMVRPYIVPFGKFGMCAIAGAGFIVCGRFYVIGLFPPNDVNIGNKSAYLLTIFTIDTAIGLLPYLLLQIFKKPSWKNGVSIGN